MSNLFVCQICGEPYIGGSAPDDCPFCGAPIDYLESVDKFSTLWGTDLTEQEEKDIKETVGLEVNAVAYYADVANNNEKYSKIERLFKRLSSIEEEHAEVACKLLGIDEPEMVGEKSRGSISEDLKRTRELEAEAIRKYKEFLKRSEHEDVKNFFKALIHAESGHHELVEGELQ